MKNVIVNKDGNIQRATYEAPAVIYEGLISTRAGSSILGGAGSNSSPDGSVDTSDLFDN